MVQDGLNSILTKSLGLPEMKKTITMILDAVEFDDKGKLNEEKTNKDGL